MPNAPEPGGATPKPGDASGERPMFPSEAPTESQPVVPSDPESETVVISKSDPDADADAGTNPEGQRERRFTAPGFDAKETTVIATSADPATEIIPSSAAPPTSPAAAAGPGGPASPGAAAPPPASPGMAPKTAVPQSIPPREGPKARGSVKRVNWGWVLAIVVVLLALAAIAILGTVLLTRGKHTKVSQEDQVRHTIQQLDVALQTGDLAKLRGITCGTTRDGYVEYDEHAWQESYQRVAAAKQYPVIASIDQVVVNGQHAEANITTYMAFDPQTRSTRSLDLQFRDDQWKVCQSPSG